MVVLHQLDMFDVMESAVSNSFVAGGFLPIAEEFESCAEKMAKYPARLSGRIITVSSKPFDIGGGWVTFSFKLENGESVYFRINSDEEMRFPDDRARTLEFEIRTFEESYFLCVTGRSKEAAPVFSIDYTLLLEVLEKSKRTGQPISEYPSGRYSWVDAYTRLSFDEVFAGEGENHHRLFIKNFERVDLVFTQKILDMIKQNVLHDVGPFYRISHIEGDTYRLDLCYDHIIGGGTVCFFESHDLSEYIVKKEQKGAAVIAVPKQTRKLEDEWKMLIVKDDNRILLPSEELDHYSVIKRTLEEADGVYEKGGFNFRYGGVQDMLDAIIAGKKVRKRQKAYKFFATKDEWAQRVVDAVVIEPMMRVAEFHAGHGAIADVVRSRGVEPIVNELWEENANVLLEKGYRDVLQMDFLAMTEADINGKVDVIVGNPPWERLSDLTHFNHAMTLLAEGGSISMLISPSYKTSKTKKAQAFREFLREHNATETDVPKGAFDNTSMGGVHVVITDYTPA
ncbi:hypothetical protein [Vibrio owensii]|uniref:hypothetical protein n=1 Tax=Vibrio owensii TaxID=696485 RepID=UPI0018F1B599|nr:hypothetical protein [Vibrio owensii]